MLSYKNDIYFLLTDNSASRRSYLMDLNLENQDIKKIGSIAIGDGAPIVSVGKGRKAISVFSFHNALPLLVTLVSQQV